MSRIPSSPSLFGTHDDDQRALREAFAAIRLESTSSTRKDGSVLYSSPSDTPSTRRRHSELVISPRTVQQTAAERRASLEDLWMDPSSNFTLSCLESQFKQMRDIDTSRLTKEDYEALLQANFRALNEQIVRDGLLFIKEVQIQEKLAAEERRLHAQILRLQEQQQQQMFDPQYAPNVSTEVYYGPHPYSHYLASLDPLSNGHSRHGSQGTVPSSRSSIEGNPPVHFHPSHLYYSHYPPPKPDDYQEAEAPGGRSASWSSPRRDQPTTDPQTRPRGASHADYAPYYTSMASARTMQEAYPEYFIPGEQPPPFTPSMHHVYATHGYEYHHPPSQNPSNSSREESPHNGSPSR